MLKTLRITGITAKCSAVPAVASCSWVERQSVAQCWLKACPFLDSGAEAKGMSDAVEGGTSACFSFAAPLHARLKKSRPATPPSPSSPLSAYRRPIFPLRSRRQRGSSIPRSLRHPAKVAPQHPTSSPSSRPLALAPFPTSDLARHSTTVSGIRTNTQAVTRQAVSCRRTPLFRPARHRFLADRHRDPLSPHHLTTLIALRPVAAEARVASYPPTRPVSRLRSTYLLRNHRQLFSTTALHGRHIRRMTQPDPGLL